MSNPTPMNNSSPTSTKTPDAVKSAMSKEISAKWSKFSEQDVSAFKTSDELVTQIVAKYGQDKMAVQKDVDTFLKGRSFN